MLAGTFILRSGGVFSNWLGNGVVKISDLYITQFTQPDQIIPDPTNPLDFNRYSYARYNPIRFNDPTGHYVCTGSNEKWGEKTCYDIVNNWLDYLYKQGGDEGKSLVEQFMKADAQYTIRIDFLDPGVDQKKWTQKMS